MRGQGKRWTLQTDLVPYPHDSAAWLLVYSVISHDRNTHLLTTMFPVTQDVVDELRVRAKQAKREDIRLRYNCHIAGVQPVEYRGTCRLREF